MVRMLIHHTIYVFVLTCAGQTQEVVEQANRPKEGTASLDNLLDGDTADIWVARTSGHVIPMRVLQP
jgi:hypothetical protein